MTASGRRSIVGYGPGLHLARIRAVLGHFGLVSVEQMF
jgi:hypothetical protein